MVEDLYAKRNKILHKATSYRGSNDGDTLRVRTQCFIEAFEVTKQLEALWASRMQDNPKNYNLYDNDGNITHMLLTDDGIVGRYVKVENYDASLVDIHPMTNAERLERELIKTTDTLDFIKDIEALASKVLTPTVL